MSAAIGSATTAPGRSPVLPPVRKTALLIDFGGVLTSSVPDSRAAFCRREGVDPDAFRKLFEGVSEVTEVVRRLEVGKVSPAVFEAEVARALGDGVEPEGLIARLIAGLELDPEMIAAVGRLRLGGVRVVLVTNSFGTAAYDRWDLTDFADAIVISGVVGHAKPGREIYELSLAEAGVDAGQAVFVDDMEANVATAGELGMESILHRDAATTIPRLAQAFGIDLGSS